MPVDLVTIASRCVRIEFGPIAAAALCERLVAEGADGDVALPGSGRRRRRPDARPIARRRPTVRRAARRVRPSCLPCSTEPARRSWRRRPTCWPEIEAAAAPLAARHASEISDLDVREQHLGTAGSGRAAIEARHKRELRRHRTDELRSGLATVAGTYRDALVAGTAAHPDSVIAAVHRIHAAIESFEHNPNETLLLQSLLWSLPALPPPS